MRNENQILEVISYVNNVSKKSPATEKILNHISKILASNVDLSFVTETVKQLIAKKKINDNFKIVEEVGNGNLNQSNDEVQTILNEELNETLDGSSTTPQLLDDKELEILIVISIVTLKRKR